MRDGEPSFEQSWIALPRARQVGEKSLCGARITAFPLLPRGKRRFRQERIRVASNLGDDKLAKRSDCPGKSAIRRSPNSSGPAFPSRCPPPCSLRRRGAWPLSADVG